MTERNHVADALIADEGPHFVFLVVVTHPGTHLVAATLQTSPLWTKATLYRARVTATYNFVADFSTCLMSPDASHLRAGPCG